MKLQFFLSLMFFLLAPLLFAGDKATFQFLGFSQDGQFLAFSQEGVQDGSGFFYGEVYILDVKKNNYAKKPFIKQWQDPDYPQYTKVKEEWYQEREKELQPIKIHLSNQRTYLKPQDSQKKQMDFTYQNKKYQLSLKLSVFEKNCFGMGNDSKMLDLRIQQGQKEIILQKDKKLPQSRGCAFDYQIAHVWLYQNSIAVALEVKRTGFEGPDTRWMMISGQLP